jgi:hypothetical protein
VLGAALLAALGWAGVLAAAPAAMVWLCGAGGVVPSLAAWDPVRLAVLAVMWCAMLPAMALPCALLAQAFESSRRRPLPPRIVRLLWLAIGAAIIQWAMESAALLDLPPAQLALLAAVSAIELAKWRRPSTHIAPALQMVGLQLLWPTSLPWMAIVTLWMLADALLPERQALLAAVRRPAA